MNAPELLDQFVAKGRALLSYKEDKYDRAVKRRKEKEANKKVNQGDTDDGDAIDEGSDDATLEYPDKEAMQAKATSSRGRVIKRKKPHDA